MPEMNQPVGGVTKTIEVTPTVSTSPAYTAEDQVGGIMTLVGAAGGKFKTATLMSLSVVDKAKQSVKLVVYLFDELPTVASSDNAALDISDAEMADKAKAKVTIDTTDYEPLSANSFADMGLSRAKAITSRTDGGNLYAVMKTTGAPTYASTSDLVLTFTFAQDQSDAR